MERKLNKENKVLNRVKTGIEAVIDFLDENRGAIVPAGLAVAGGIAIATSTAKADAPAPNQELSDYQKMEIMDQLMIEEESTPAYQSAHPTDLLNGFGFEENTRAAGVYHAFPGVRIPERVVGWVARGPALVSPNPAAYAALGAQAEFDMGSQPIVLPVQAGHSMLDSMQQCFTGANHGGVVSQNGFDLCEYFRTADAASQQRAMDAMVAMIHTLGADAEYSAIHQQSESYSMHKEVLLAGILGLAGYVPQTVQPAQPTQPVQPVQPVQPTVIFTPGTQPGTCPAQPTQPVQPVEPVHPTVIYTPGTQPGTCPAQPVEPVQPVQPVEPVQPVQPVEPVAPVEPVQPVVDPCADPAFASTMEGIQAQYTHLLADGECDAAMDAVMDDYVALRVDCPARADEIDAATQTLSDKVEECRLVEAERVRVHGADVGGGFLTGPGISHSGWGRAYLEFANSDEAQVPLHLFAYADGGNYFVDQLTGRPFAGAMLGLGGEKWELRFSADMDWLNQISSYNNGPVTVGPNTIDIEGGTETTTETSSDWGSSTTEGYLPSHWFVAGEGSGVVDEWKLHFGLGYGQDSHHQLDTANSNIHSDIAQDSVFVGPPDGSVHSETSADVDASTVNLTDVITRLIAFRAEAVRDGGEWSYGGALSVFANWSDVAGSTTVDTNVDVGDTTTTVSMDGFPDETIVTPGSTTTSHDVTPINVATAYQVQFMPQLRLHYDKQDLALRIDPAMIVGFDNQGVMWTGMPVGGNVTAIAAINDNLSLGGNAYWEGNDFNASFLLATTGFDGFVGYVDRMNDLRVSVMDEHLRDRYAQMLFDRYVAGNDGVVLDLGFGVDGNADGSFHGTVAYVHQFPGVGPLGASVGTRVAGADEWQLRAAGYVPLTHGLAFIVDGHTENDPVAQARSWGMDFFLTFNYDLLLHNDRDEEDK